MRPKCIGAVLVAGLHWPDPRRPAMNEPSTTNPLRPASLPRRRLGSAETRGLAFGLLGVAIFSLTLADDAPGGRPRRRSAAAAPLRHRRPRRLRRPAERPLAAGDGRAPSRPRISCRRSLVCAARHRRRLPALPGARAAPGRRVACRRRHRRAAARHGARRRRSGCASGRRAASGPARCSPPRWCGLRGLAGRRAARAGRRPAAGLGVQRRDRLRGGRAAGRGDAGRARDLLGAGGEPAAHRAGRAAASGPIAPRAPPAWGGFAYVTVFSMWLGFFAWYRGLALGGTMRVSQVQLLQPFLAMLFAVPLLGERLDAAMLAFAAAVVAVVVVGRRMPVGAVRGRSPLPWPHPDASTPAADAAASPSWRTPA